MVGLFLYREYGGGDVIAPPAEPQAFVPQDQWMGIYLGDDSRIGHLHLRSAEERRDEVPGYRMRLKAALETTLFGVTASMDIGGDAWTATKGDLAEFQFTLNTADTEMGLRGTVQDDRLKGFLDTGGEAVPLDFPVDSKLILGAGLGMPTETLPRLAPGDSTTIEAFDPMAMKLSRATVTCTGEETITVSGAEVTTRVYETTLGDMTSRAWVDDAGEVLQASTPFGFTLRKIDPAELDDVVVANADSDMVQQLAILPSGAPVFVDARALVVRVGGVPPEKFPHDPPGQQRDGDLVTVRQQPPPTTPAAQEDGFDPTPYLGADAFVTTDHPLITDQVRNIVGDEMDPWQRATLLYTWVYDNIEKVPVLSVPNALDVLRTRAGDCNEHTVLYTALARAAGIPARIAIGLVYSDTLEGFGYHAWPEVHVMGGWIPMDPTLGQLTADATHIKILNGGIETWVQLAGLIGQIDLEVITCE